MRNDLGTDVGTSRCDDRRWMAGVIAQLILVVIFIVFVVIEIAGFQCGHVRTDGIQAAVFEGALLQILTVRRICLRQRLLARCRRISGAERRNLDDLAPEKYVRDPKAAADEAAITE